MDIDTKRKYFLGEGLYEKCKNGSASSYDMLKRAKQLGMTIEQIVQKCELNYSDSPRRSSSHSTRIETQKDEVEVEDVDNEEVKDEEIEDDTDSEIDDDNPIEWDY